MKFDLRTFVNVSLSAAILIGAGMGIGEIAANAMGKRQPQAQALTGFAEQIHEDVRTSLIRNAESKSLLEFEESGYSPADIFANVRALKSADASKALCDELLALPGKDLALFEEEIKAAEKSGDLACADTLGARVFGYWNEARFKLAQSHGHKFAMIGKRDGETTPVSLPSVEHEIDAEKEPVLIRAELNPGQIAITLDDGPHPTLTPQMLTILKNAGVRATFFEVGRNAKTWPELSKAEVAGGHTVGSHSWDHPDLPKLPLDHAEAEITSGRDQVNLSAGVSIPFFRFPYGDKSAPLLEFTRQQGLASFFWNMDSEDWKRRDPNDLFQHVLGELNREKRGIILFHDIHQQTVIVMPHVLEELQKRGWETVVFVPH